MVQAGDPDQAHPPAQPERENPRGGEEPADEGEGLEPVPTDDVADAQVPCFGATSDDGRPAPPRAGAPLTSTPPASVAATGAGVAAATKEATPNADEGDEHPKAERPGEGGVREAALNQEDGGSGLSTQAISIAPPPRSRPGRRSCRQRPGGPRCRAGLEHNQDLLAQPHRRAASGDETDEAGVPPDVAEQPDEGKAGDRGRNGDLGRCESGRGAGAGPIVDGEPDPDGRRGPRDLHADDRQATVGVTGAEQRGPRTERPERETDGGCGHRGLRSVRRSWGAAEPGVDGGGTCQSGAAHGCLPTTGQATDG